LNSAPIILLVAATALCFAGGTEAKQSRSHAAKAEFKRLQLCPSTGQQRGPCPGWIIDHVTPLCAGGKDHSSNMQWQTIVEAKAKDKDERRLCRVMR
jgi:hypothetical protein